MNVRLQILSLTAAAAALVMLFAALGQWQLRRAAEEQHLSRQFLQGAELAALTAAPPAARGAELRYRRVELRGRYLPDVQVLLDNMTHAGVAGYHVLTAFVPATGGPAIPVNRGWLPAAPDRRELPVVAVDDRERVLYGRIDTLPVPGLRLGDARGVPQSGPLRVLTFPRREDLELELGRELAPYQVLLDAAEPDGYLREWGPRARGGERNLVYAGQWFMLAAAAGLGALGMALRTLWRRRATRDL